MMYRLLTLDDDTEIVHSEMLPDGEVKVYFERPDAEKGFLHATCMLPGYVWRDVYGFTKEDMARFQEVVESCAHLIMEFSTTGGFDNAAGF